MNWKSTDIYQQEYMARLTEEASKKEGRSIEQTLSVSFLYYHFIIIILSLYYLQT